jgi:hypothetical protein
MAFDPISDNLWMQENGDNSFREINRILPACPPACPSLVSWLYRLDSSLPAFGACK